MPIVQTQRTLSRWRVTLFLVFMSIGIAIASWASRVPAIRDSLGLDNVAVGIALFVVGAGSIVGLTLGPAIYRVLGARATISVGIVLATAGLIIVAVASTLTPSYALLLVGFTIFGIPAGAVDVIQNVEGADIERAYNRTLLPMFHAFFSLGTVVGAMIGFLFVLAGVDVLVHFLAISAVMVIVAVMSATGIPDARARAEIVPVPAAPTPAVTQRKLATYVQAWREPRTYVLGIVILGMAFAEGGANDWLALAVVDGHHQAEEVGVAALVVFSIAMTASRMLGGWATDRFGRVRVLRVLAFLAAAGLLLFILAPNIVLAFVGVALWGVGAALGFPLGLSAAADDPNGAAARVAAAATIGYVAFLCGPPLLGLISEQIGLLNTLYILVALTVACGLAASGARPVRGTRLDRETAR